MKKKSMILKLLPLCLLWLMLCGIFWGWVNTFLTDTTMDRKLSVFISPMHQAREELAWQL